MTAEPQGLYEADFLAWTRDQAAALRRLAAERWNGPLDLAHLAEEMEDLGATRRDAARSQLRRIIEHCLKLEYSPAAAAREGWRDSVIDARAELEDLMTPSIGADLADQLDRLYRKARLKAENGLAKYRETEAARRLPSSCPYSLQQLLDDSWYPKNRHGLDQERT